MKKNNLIILIGIAFFTAIIAFILSTVVFKPLTNRSTKVPVTGSISTSFPDIKNDSAYNTIFNGKAFDAAVPINASNSLNNQPFNSH